MREIGLYLHIPFCVKKCRYCDFASVAGGEDLYAPYVRRVKEEIRAAARRDVCIRTLYVGGGTPSVLPAPMMGELLGALREAFRFVPGAECSMEMNPGTVREDMLGAMRAGGINRVSLGMQCAQDRLLEMLGRIHRFADVENSVRLIRRAGFDNFNLDLMLGLPFQRAEDVEESLQRAMDLGCTHLSCYGLIVEDGTEMARRVRSGEWVLPDEDTEREMYDLCLRNAASRGLEQYEISNFALPGRECRHNLDIWKRGEYIGIGCAAAGFIDGVRYTNPRSLRAYLRGEKGEEERISPEDAMFESVMLGLRLTRGVSGADFYRMHGRTLEEEFGQRWGRPMANGLLVYEDGFLRLTRRGMDVQNSVLVDLMR